MYIGIIQAALQALGLIWNKKIVSNKNIGNHLQIFFMRTIHIIVLSSLVIVGSFFGSELFSFSIPREHINLLNLFIVAAGTLSLYITYLLRNIAYRNEKVSTLQPYAMLYQVLPPIIAFLFISSQKTSLTTFIISLVASGIIIVTSVNWRNIKINRYCIMVGASSVIKSIQMYYMIYLISFLSQSTFYILECLFLLLISSFFSAKGNEFSSIKKIDKKYFLTLIFGQSIILSSIILSLTMFKNFGVIVTSLIGLLYLVFAFLFGYIFLKEIPTKKDVIVTSLVGLCVIIGVVFR